jgi:hypothetical protein
MHHGGLLNDSGAVAELFASYFSGATTEALKTHFGSNLSLPCTTVQSVNITSEFPRTPITSIEVIEVITSTNSIRASDFQTVTTL